MGGAGQGRRGVSGRARWTPRGITRSVLESALDAELGAHLDEAGVDEATGRRTNIRNGHGAKTVQTEVGPVRIQVPPVRTAQDEPTVPAADGIARSGK
ncbi:transposase [Plantactinospora sp. WMMB782]|uniref:transposase n=1 Tax=Plantactinospora sp. WMMB782 TaxID=3404121 RepID=UPI003B923D16